MLKNQISECTNLKLLLLRCYISSVLNYDCKSWRLDSEVEKDITAFNLNVYRRIKKISWTHKTRNEECFGKNTVLTRSLAHDKKKETKLKSHVKGEKRDSRKR